MSTQFDGEGNIGSPPEYKLVPGKEGRPDRHLLKLNVYFDNRVPVGTGKDATFEDRGGFWLNIDWWHSKAASYADIFKKGMRIKAQGRLVLEQWEDKGEDFEAFKLQAESITIHPHRIETVALQDKAPAAQ